MLEEHIVWCRNLFDHLKDGGVWGVPVCGLLFQRRGDMFVLLDQMPHDPKMPITAEQLREQQEYMYQECVRHFGAAGITVSRKQ